MKALIRVLLGIAVFGSTVVILRLLTASMEQTETPKPIIVPPPPCIPWPPDGFVLSGGAPYEYVPRYTLRGFNRHQKTRNALIWASRAWYMEKSMRTMWGLVEVLSLHPNIGHVLVYGPDFCGYDASRSILDNAAHVFPGIVFDFVLIEYVVGQHQLTMYKKLDELPIPVVAIFHECQALGRCDKMIVQSNLDIVLFSETSEMLRFAHLVSDRIFAVAPQAIAVATNRFNGDPFGERPTDILLVGNLMRIYPFRRHLAKLIEDKRLKGVILPRQTTSITQYAEALSKAKVVLITSSVMRMPLKKYAEAACSGALVVGDIPLFMSKEIAQITTPINHDMSDAQLIKTIEDALNDPKREEIAARRQDICRNLFGSQRYIEIMLESLDDFEGKRLGVRSEFPERRVDCVGELLSMSYEFTPSAQCVKGSQMERMFNSKRMNRLRFHTND